MSTNMCLQLKAYSYPGRLNLVLKICCFQYYCSVCKMLKLVTLRHNIKTPSEHTSTVECFCVSMIETMITCSFNCLFQLTSLQKKHVLCQSVGQPPCLTTSHFTLISLFLTFSFSSIPLGIKQLEKSFLWVLVFKKNDTTCEREICLDPMCATELNFLQHEAHLFIFY